jgi:N-acetylglucosamine kinase-like BadF-type ATPase
MIAVLGVDGGQTTIRLRHIGDDREVEVEGVSRQHADAIDAVASAVMAGWQQLGSPPAERVVLGLSTAPIDPAGSDRLGHLIGRSLDAREVWLTDDAVTAHAGALSARPGVSIVVGTGVACLAVPAEGTPRIIGGHGFLLGDDGGGFWIGRSGLRAALRADDGRGGQTILTASAERRYGSLSDLHVRLHDADRPVAAIAAFAPDVLDAAEHGDEVANAIVGEAVDEVLLLAETGARWVGDADVPVALGGRLLAAGSPLRVRLERCSIVNGSALLLRDADGSPLDGAIWLGLAGETGPYRELIHVWRRSAM